jgi:hypothetical protein
MYQNVSLGDMMQQMRNCYEKLFEQQSSPEDAKIKINFVSKVEYELLSYLIDDTSEKDDSFYSIDSLKELNTPLDAIESSSESSSSYSSSLYLKYIKSSEAVILLTKVDPIPINSENSGLVFNLPI